MFASPVERCGNSAQIVGMYRKAPVWRKLAEELKKRNFDHTLAQVDMKIKQLKNKYKDEVDKLQKSGVGIEAATKMIFL